MSEFLKYCSICGGKQKYLTKRHYNRAIKNNTKCRSCSKKGRNNSNYGKHMTEEIKKILSIKHSGKNNPFFGKRHSERSKLKISKNHPNFKGKNHPQYGTHRSDKTKEKLRLSHLQYYGEKHAQFGTHPSNQTKQKMRISRINNINEKYGQSAPNYNPIACQYFNKLMIEKNIFIQHAENGGEYYIDELGYWADGYDKINNIIYEFDEKHHFNALGNLKDKDIQRQNEIEKLLKCQFYRIKFNEIN